MATYLGTNTTARISVKPLVARLNSSAKIMPPTMVTRISPMEYRKVTFREFHRYLAPDPANSHFQFLSPTYSHVGLRRFQSVKLICTSFATG